MRKISYNIDIIFYETMMFLLIETLKNATSEIIGNVRVFFRDEDEVLSFIIGEKYDFKKLTFEEDYFSIKLANAKGKFKIHNIPYKSVVGFCSDVIYMMYTDHKYDYNYKEWCTVLPSKLNTLFSYQIRQNLSDIEQIHNKTIRITFFKNFPGVSLPQFFANDDKLLVLVLENREWSAVTDSEGLHLKFQDIQGKVFLPYNSIVTYFNDYDGLFLNRNVKVTAEDFAQDYYYTCDGNLVYVDFNELVEDNLTGELYSFLDKNNMSNGDYPNNKVMEDNLIIGSFHQYKDVEDINKR